MGVGTLTVLLKPPNRAALQACMVIYTTTTTDIHRVSDGHRPFRLWTSTYVITNNAGVTFERTSLRVDSRSTFPMSVE